MMQKMTQNPQGGKTYIRQIRSKPLQRSPLTPTQCSNQEIRMLWSTVSNAAIRSRSTRTA